VRRRGSRACDVCVCVKVQEVDNSVHHSRDECGRLIWRTPF